MNSFLATTPCISLITGHYGSGKTNFAVNLALSLRAQGQAVTVIDLDIVNPYFRTADFASLFEAQDIQLITPQFANSNLDIPALSGAVDAALLQSDRHVIVDVGGDDAGAIALGRYAPLLQNQSYRCYYVVNAYRYMTRTPEEAAELLDEIERVSRIQVTDLVNNSNLGVETTLQDVLDTNSYADALVKLVDKPLACTCVPTKPDKFDRTYMAVNHYIKSI